MQDKWVFIRTLVIWRKVQRAALQGEPEVPGDERVLGERGRSGRVEGAVAPRTTCSRVRHRTLRHFWRSEIERRGPEPL